MQRVVVTGMGAVSAFGVGAETLWKNLKEGRNGISSIKDQLPIRGEIVGIGASLPKIDLASYAESIPALEERPAEDDTVPLFHLAVDEAVRQSGFLDVAHDPRRVGCFIADRAPGVSAYLDQYTPLLHRAMVDGTLDKTLFWEQLRVAKVDKPVPYRDADSINHFSSRALGLRGPQLSVATACASGTNAIGEAMVKIRAGVLDSCIAGGAFGFDIIGMIGFTRIGALTTNPDPETACSPFDRRRSGFVMGSGCAVLVLEAEESARRRGAKILGVVSGYGSYSDAFRATDPDPEARGATRTIRACLNDARIDPEQVDYVNAHGTSTKMNDHSETVALKNVLGHHAYNVPVSSTKSMIGHAIMAAGSLEAVAGLCTIRDGVIHPTRNYSERDPDLDLDYVPGQARQAKVRHVLSNSFGFGGQNASILLSEYAG